MEVEKKRRPRQSINTGKDEFRICKGKRFCTGGEVCRGTRAVCEGNRAVVEAKSGLWFVEAKSGLWERKETICGRNQIL